MEGSQLCCAVGYIYIYFYIYLYITPQGSLGSSGLLGCPFMPDLLYNIYIYIFDYKWPLGGCILVF